MYSLSSYIQVMKHVYTVRIIITGAICNERKLL